MKKWSIAIASFLFAASAYATPALTFDVSSGGFLPAGNRNQSLGWTFTVLSAIDVNWLGWYDQDQNGLDHEHMVGLWDPTGILLKSVLVPAGTVAGLDGVYRMVSIPTITLTPGADYVVGGENFLVSLDGIKVNVTQTIDASLSYGGPIFSALEAGFVEPDDTTTSGTTGFYGPMFGFAVAAVPEPATVALLALGLAGFGFRSRKQA